MTSHALLTFPLVIPLATLALLYRAGAAGPAQQLASIAGSVLLLAASLGLLASVHDGKVLVTQFSSWPAPFGITFVADLLSAGMVVIAGVMAVTVVVYHLADGGGSKRARVIFHPLFHGLLLGLVGAFLTGDIFNLYVWFEIMLISSFGLLVLQRSGEQLDAGVKYALLNLVATSILLLSVGFLYGLAGTLNMADLSRTLPTIANQGLVTTLAVLFLVAFAAKAAAFPLFFWLPASYPSASIPVAAIFAALLTKVGVYALLRVVTLLFAPGTVVSGGIAIGMIVAVIAPLSMVTGVLGAAAHFDMRRILAFHSISQIGYMLIGVAVATPLVIAGAIFFIAHHSIVKTSLFLIAGVVHRAGGSFDVRDTGGLYRREPLLAALFFIQAMSLAGLPPLSGFWAKFVLLRGTLDEGRFVIALVAFAVSLLTLYSMLKIWNEAFWKAPPDSHRGADSAWSRMPVARRWTMLLPILGLSALTIAMGLCAEPLIDYATRAGEQLSNPAVYVEAVLGTSAPPDETLHAWEVTPWR